MNNFILAFIVYWLSGMLGGFLLWLDWKRTFPLQVGKCLTRRGVLKILLGGMFGIVLFGIGLLVSLIALFESKSKNKDSWWDKPVC